MSHHSHVMSSGADPEQQIAAMMLVNAREGCAAGNMDDCRWLSACGLPYVLLIAPADVDEFDVLNRLFDGLPCSDPDFDWREAAATFTQVVLNAVIGDAEIEHSIHAGSPHAIEPISDPIEPKEPCEDPSPYGTDWGRGMATRPATRPREPTPAMQMAMAGMEAT